MKRRKLLRILGGAAMGLGGLDRLWLSGLLPAGTPLAQAATQAGGEGSPAGAISEPLLPLFPLRVVLLPGNSLPLYIFEPRYREMIRECIDTKAEFGILLTDGGALEPVGCTATITDVIHKYTDGRFDILTRGQRRFRIGAPGESLAETDLNAARSFFRGAAQFFADDALPSPGRQPGAESPDDDLRVQAIELHSQLLKLIAEDEPNSALPAAPRPAASDPLLSYHLMDGLPADVEWKQELLELRVERERLVRVLLHLQRLIEFMESDSDQPAPRRAAFLSRLAREASV